ncbi:SDR family oxidoreductase [Kingella negevensis]|uniref:SDR family oxidoreductase n=1 Tax=Kingella negevensis TaxID=1522312 RepID=UPI00050A1589|nr:SDR family NAD(P)-dependent oxidoreductase [Kingella negevensis]MDK4679893.1 SDR family NAD(P)-dependent oxidoreductase [Kingella negevensis]MDK4682388.1 SDR family NAD(P)-dependent oxidoreductase [Kingella negevensis]MDK4688926.1 SDR family NAD(P)-dependent oxidoreductase [Kingella negevensis]MDK4690585.1 SDR family NAD(P)-dependent oxidoreductase [Kingella negevensis]MDK4692067.1 SDR family NAD(P)-dependent oxidoreductase [Kingella negevensis]
MKLNGHTVLITGGATGIGFALAKKFHTAGNQIILVGRREDVLQQAAAQLSGCRIAVADVSKTEDRERLVRDFPEVSVLVNNAGIQFTKRLDAQNDDEIAQEININLTAPAQLTRAFLPILTAKQESAVINVSSGLAIVPKETCALYCATKAALHSFSQVLRWQMENTSLRVFEIMPPMVATPMSQGKGHANLKISPDELADEFWRDFERNHFEIMAGKTKLLYWINRISATLGQRIMRKGL